MLATSVQCRLKQRVTVSLVVEARLVADDAGGYDTKCEPVRTCIPPPATHTTTSSARHSAALERDGVGLGCSPHTSAADREKYTAHICGRRNAVSTWHPLDGAKGSAPSESSEQTLRFCSHHELRFHAVHPGYGRTVTCRRMHRRGECTWRERALLDQQHEDRRHIPV